MELKGRTALVTGAGVRVGRAIAIALAGEGMRVAVHYAHSADGAHETVGEIKRNGGEAAVHQADLTDGEAASSLVADVVRRFAALDVLVNSAAVMLRTPVGEVTLDAWDHMFALNLRAPFFLSQAAATVLGERNGAIVNIADLAAFETWPGYIPHSVSKAGIVHMTRGLAHALAPKVRVNAVAPGTVLLPEDWAPEAGERLAATTPLGRAGSPADVTDAVLYLLRADYVTGETIIVDGGRHVRH
ncbi:MAG TPA: SDR family oxidoreductase [Gemmatimonadaceae bacterium]|nr:SDR family oxidoreductase [Gemmatimonadaceae bacterium]